MIRELKILVGPPGCGGGALIKEMKKRKGKDAVVFSTGSRFRKIAKDEGHKHHQEVKEFMPLGFYLSDETTIDVFHETWYGRNLSGYNELWLDKVIRTGVQADALIPLIINQWIPDNISIISIETPLEICKERILVDRKREESRCDDNEESIENRFAEWESNHDNLFEALNHHAQIFRFKALEMRRRDAPMILDQLGIFSPDEEYSPYDEESPEEKRMVYA